MSFRELSNLDMGLAELRALLRKHPFTSLEIRLRDDGRVAFSFCDKNGFERRTVHADLLPDSDGKYPSEAIAETFGSVSP